MANDLSQILENFEELDGNYRRVLVCRLKKRKAKLEQQLDKITLILEKEKIQRPMRRELRDYTVSQVLSGVE